MNKKKKQIPEKPKGSLDFFRESIEKIQETGSSYSVAPNVFLQTLMFRPISKDSDRVFTEKFEEICGFANDNYEIMVYKRGEDLDQNDLDLYLWLISKTDDDFKCSFTRREALLGCYRDVSKANYDWLDKSLDRLMFVNMKFFQREKHGRGKRIYGGTLLAFIKDDDSTKSKNRMMVQLTPLARILHYDKSTLVDKATKGGFVKNQLARYLYDWFRANDGTKGFHFKKDLMIYRLKRGGETDKNFVQRLKKNGLDSLVKLGILKDYEIKKDTIFLVWDKNFDNEKNNSIEVKKTIRKEYSKERKIQKVKPKKNVRQVTEELISKPDDDGGTWPRTGWATDWEK